MNSLFKIILLLFCCIELHAQKIHVGFSIHSMIDYNWSKPIQGVGSQSPFFFPNLRSRVPLSFSFLLEKRNLNISPSIGLSLIQRNLLSTQSFTNLGHYSHQTIQMHMNFTKRKNINNSASLIFSLGGGLSYILTPKDMTIGGTIDLLGGGTDEEFKINNLNKMNGFVNSSLGIENRLKNGSILQFKFEYVYYFATAISYSSVSFNVIRETNPFRVNYASFGLTFFPPFSKKTESKNTSF